MSMYDANGAAANVLPESGSPQRLPNLYQEEPQTSGPVTQTELSEQAPLLKEDYYDYEDYAAAEKISHRPENVVIEEVYEGFFHHAKLTDMHIHILFGLIFIFATYIIMLKCAFNIFTSSLYKFLLGYALAYWILGVFLVVVVFYVVAVVIYDKCGKKEEKNEMALISLVQVSGLILGLGLLLLHGLFGYYYGTIVDQLDDDCTSGATTGILYDQFVEMLAIRQSPVCARLPTIELCTGFNASDYPQLALFQDNEVSYRCSGYCITIANEETAANVTSIYKTHKHHALTRPITTSSADLKKVLLKPRPPKSLPVQSLLEDHQMDLLPSSYSASTVTLPRFTYPPTLFSLANFPSSCTATISDALTYNFGSWSSFAYYEGISIIVLVILVWILKVYLLISDCKLYPHRSAIKEAKEAMRRNPLLWSTRYQQEAQ